MKETGTALKAANVKPACDAIMEAQRIIADRLYALVRNMSALSTKDAPAAKRTAAELGEIAALIGAAALPAELYLHMARKRLMAIMRWRSFPLPAKKDVENLLNAIVAANAAIHAKKGLENEIKRLRESARA